MTGNFGPFARSSSAVRFRRVIAAIKREINLLLGSELVEEKSYASTKAAPRPSPAMPMPQRAMG